MFKKLFSSELGRGAIVLFVMMNVFNVLNFVFHFLMGRMLGPSDYGILAVLMSFVYIYGIPSEAIQNLASRYTSKFNLEKDKGKIKFMIVKFFKKGIKIAGLIFLVSILFSIFLANFLKINFWLIFLTNLLIFTFFIGPLFRGILQGRKKFSSLGSSMVIESSLKLFFAFSLVLFGFKIFGAIIGVLLSVFSGLIILAYFNKDILKEKIKETSFDGIYSVSTNYLVVMFVILLVFSLDIILAKRFFSAELAGKYSVLSMLGKIIFLGTIAISKVMFPLTSEKHENKKNSFNLFKKSFIIVAVLCLIVTTAYALFPKLIIGLLYGEQYLDVANYLVYSGIALSFLSLSNLTLIYGLSIDRIKNPYPLFVFLIIEITLLSLFHNTMLNYIFSFMVSNIIMFIGSFLFIKFK